MRLPTIQDFAAEATDPGRYRALPGDWAMAVADVVASTRMAEAGRARDVNFVAGAVVAVLSEVLGAVGAPAACQFAGDGAMAAVPPGRVEAARAALEALAHWSASEMDVPLRVGLVGVDELMAAGHEVLVALHDFGNGNVFGLFLGTGVAEAEVWVKADPARQLRGRPGPLPGLAGLSCRWHPVPARRGLVLCVIVDPVADGEAGINALREIARAIEAVVPTSDAAPLGAGEPLRPRWPPSPASLWREVRTEPPSRRPWRLFKAVVGAGLIRLGHALGGRLGPLNVAAYRRAVAERSDYRKAAGGHRFVLDVTELEAQAIEALLAERAATGAIRYGTARAGATTITCLVGDFAADRHVHFVDGDELGFWRASIPLKAMRGKEPAGAKAPVGQRSP